MKILYLTQCFDPEPALKGVRYIKALMALGHEVEVVTGFPNYPYGKIYPGYKLKLFQRECIDGVQVLRLPLYPSQDRSAIRRILTYSTLAGCMFFYSLFKRSKPDVIWAYSLPTIGVVAGMVGFLRKVPFIFDIQDLWPDSLVATGFIKQGRVFNIIGRVCQWIYRRSAKTIVLAPGMKELLIKKGVPENKIEVIYNFCDEATITDTKNKTSVSIDPQKNFNIVFAGNLGRAQNLTSVISAARKVEEVNPTVLFTFIGNGIEKENLQKFTKALGVKNVQFLPEVPLAEIGAVLRAADVLIVHLKNEQLFTITIPSKTQAYMAIGKPILMAVKGDAANLVEQAGAGICTEPDNIDLIARAALQFAALDKAELARLGKNAEAYYHKHLSLKKNIELFDALIQKIVLQEEAD